MSQRRLTPYLRGGVTLACLLLYVAWASVLPVSQAPDESTRLAVPFWIARHGCLPSGFEESIRNTLWGISYAFTPYGSSLLSALFVKAASALGCSVAAQVVAARLSSCICGAGTVYVVMLLGDELAFAWQTTLVAGLGLGLLPQFAFMSSYLNNDIFSALCAALVILAWVRGLKSDWRARDCALLGIALGLLSLSYYFAYALIPLSVVVFFVSSARQNAGIRAVLIKALTVLCVALAVGGWFFVRNAVCYSGDFLGMKAYSECAERYASAGYRPSDHGTPRLAGEPFMSPLWDAKWLLLTFMSSVGVLGYLDCYLPVLIYPAVLALLVAGLALNFVPGLGEPPLRRALSAEPQKRRALIVALAASALAPVLFSAYRSWATDYQAQGRYVISAWIPVLLCFAMGLDRLMRALEKSKSRTCATAALIGLSVCILIAVFSVYYPTGFAGVANGLTLKNGPAIMAGLLW